MGLWIAFLLTMTVASAQTDAEERPALTSRALTESCHSDGLRRVAWSLNLREQALARRERTLTQRETDLMNAQEEMQLWIAQLEGVRDEIANMLNLHSDEDKKIKALKDMVQNMRPKQAAAVLSEIDLALAVKVMDRMDRSKAGKAMAVMQPAKAAEIAEKLTLPIIVGEGQ